MNYFLYPLFQALNASVIFRVALPKALYEAIHDAQESLVSEWLEAEYVAVTDNSEETNMSDVATWNAEIAELVKIITIVDEIDVEGDTAVLETVLRTVNSAKSLEIEGIYSLLDSVKANMGITSFGKVTYANNEVAKAEAWDAEITDISCSVERPPKNTPMLVFIICCFYFIYCNIFPLSR